jgi:hypothetical protein
MSAVECRKAEDSLTPFGKLRTDKTTETTEKSKVVIARSSERGENNVAIPVNAKA